MKFKITNGKVYDPSLKLNGQVKDLYISDGKIVSPSPSEIKTFKKTYNVSVMLYPAVQCPKIRAHNVFGRKCHPNPVDRSVLLT